MKYIFLLFVSGILFSACNMNRKNDANISEVSPAVTETFEQAALDELEDDYAEFYEKNFKNFSVEGIKIFQPTSYNESDYTKELFYIMDTITGLFKMENGYSLRKCVIEKVNLYENECYGGTMIEPTLNTNDLCLYLFRGLNKYSRNAVIDTVSSGFSLLPGQGQEFTFENIDYKLKAEGKFSKELKAGEYPWDYITEYKLYLTQGDKKQCITEMRKFKDTKLEIVFIGDLDRDGRPDFIISAPDWYEDYRILLFLSDYAGDDELVKLVSIMIDSFAC